MSDTEDDLKFKTQVFKEKTLIIPYESFIMESQMTRNRQNGEIQIAGFAPTRLIISVFRLLIGQLK